MIAEMESAGDNTSIQTEKEVEKERVSKGTNIDGRKNSKAAEKKDQMKVGMKDVTGRGDDGKGDMTKISKLPEKEVR